MSRKAAYTAAVLLVLVECCSGVALKQEEGLEAGRQAFEASDYAKAIRLWQAAVTADPANGEIHWWLTQAYFDLQEHDAAVKSGEKAVNIDPDNSRYHEWLGRAYGQKAEHSSWFSALGFARKTRRE